MIKIWAKVLKKDKIVRQCVYEKNENVDYSLFFEYLREICEELDVATPVLIKTHLFHYAKYRTLKFRKDDFIDGIDFDYLVLENIFV